LLMHGFLDAFLGFRTVLLSHKFPRGFESLVTAPNAHDNAVVAVQILCQSGLRVVPESRALRRSMLFLPVFAVGTGNADSLDKICNLKRSGNLSSFDQFRIAQQVVPFLVLRFRMATTRTSLPG